MVGKGGRGMHTAFQWVNLKERGNLDSLGAGGHTMLSEILKKEDRKAWTGSSWVRLRTSSLLLLMR